MVSSKDTIGTFRGCSASQLPGPRVPRKRLPARRRSYWDSGTGSHHRVQSGCRRKCVIDDRKRLSPVCRGDLWELYSIHPQVWGLSACFQGSDADVCNSGQYTLPSSTVAAAVPAAPRSIALLSGSAEYGFCRAGCVVHGPGIEVLLVSICPAYHLTDHLFFSSAYSEPWSTRVCQMP